ncbi:permease [Bacillus canaveralius]|uniref:Permease n=1 Tax=Bacillus canaveralius TaxID=1403243 RepID=A0A2N5GGP4_9BACI|nr:permease [Bacillus canaveralius]PLR79870.1 permease [Bacillus canaveralius]PLR96041.1 permease [Bacillus canaveralius]RSK51594.1 permease [Bacillus canaveralius]
MWKDIIFSFLSIALELTVLFFIISFAVSILQGLIPYEKIEKYLLNSNKIVGAFVAIVLAFITPFCSCSTIPVVVGMLQKKIRFGFVMIFLFASPVLDPTILTLMGALLGWKVAIIYTVITTIFSIVIGFTLEAFGFENAVKNVIISGGKEQSSKFNLKKAWDETLSLMKTVYPYLIIGAFIGSIIHGAIPTDFITTYFGGDQWWLIPVAAIIGIPLYIRLSTMIPIAQMMIVKGMALGPVMAIMISSTGASLPEVALLNSIFHKRLVVAFILSVFSMSTLSGTLFYFI